MYYVDEPGIDKAEIVKDGKIYPVVISVPLEGTEIESHLGPVVPGFNTPEYDTITVVEDANGEVMTVTYSLLGNNVQTLNISCDDYTFVEPYKTTTIARS